MLYVEQKNQLQKSTMLSSIASNCKYYRLMSLASQGIPLPTKYAMWLCNHFVKKLLGLDMERIWWSCPNGNVGWFSSYKSSADTIFLKEKSRYKIWRKTCWSRSCVTTRLSICMAQDTKLCHKWTNSTFKSTARSLPLIHNKGLRG